MVRESRDNDYTGVSEVLSTQRVSIVMIPGEEGTFALPAFVYQFLTSG